MKGKGEDNMTERIKEGNKESSRQAISTTLDTSRTIIIILFFERPRIFMKVRGSREAEFCLHLLYIRIYPVKYGIISNERAMY